MGVATGGSARGRITLARDRVVLGPSGRFGRVWMGVALIALLLIATVFGLAASHSRHRTALTVPPRAAPVVSSVPSGVAPTASGLTRHTPATVAPAGTPIQQEYDQAFSQGLAGESGMAAASALSVPTPSISGGWPDLTVAATPEGWAQSFVAGLLDVDYSRMGRSSLGSWLDTQEAPELIPGVPATVADKVLYISLMDPGLFGGQPTPVATAAQWQSLAQAGVHQMASDLLVQADPSWAQMVAAGWQPADSRMAELDVSGSLTVFQGKVGNIHRFSLQVIVGSARWHDGYGTVAVAGWKES